MNPNKKNYVIIGLGQFGKALTICLSRRGYAVSVIDQRQSVIDEIQNDVVWARVGDACNLDVYKNVIIDDENTYFIIAVGENFQRSIIIAALLIEKGAKHIYARSVNKLQSMVLERIGVKNLLHVEEEAAKQQAARIMLSDNELLPLDSIDHNYSLLDVKLPGEWVGKTLKELNLREKYQLNLLTIRRGDAHDPSDEADKHKPVLGIPNPDAPFQEGDVLVLFGHNNHLKSFVDKFNRQ